MNRLRISILALAASLAIFCRVPPAGAADADFESVLRGIDNYYEGITSLAADFTQVVTVPALEKSDTFSGRLYFLEPRFLRLEYDTPRGQLLVADGENYWFYMPQGDVPQAMRAPLEEGQSPLYVLGGRMAERFSGELAGTEQRGGRECYVLDLRPLEPSPHYRSLRAWVDTGTYATRAIRYINQSGDFNTFDLSGIEENAGLDEAMFGFTPPPGTQILEAD